MPEFQISRRPALSDKQPVTGPGIEISAPPPGAILHALAQPGDAGARGFIENALMSDTFSIRPVSPGQWFSVADDPLSHADFRNLCEALEPRVDLVDQSHGRTRIIVQGPQVEAMLAKGTAIDLHIDQFTVGSAASTLIGHVSAHLTRTGEHCFEILVLRSFAENMWDDLVRMSRELN